MTATAPQPMDGDPARPRFLNLAVLLLSVSCLVGVATVAISEGAEEFIAQVRVLDVPMLLGICGLAIRAWVEMRRRPDAQFDIKRITSDLEYLRRENHDRRGEIHSAQLKAAVLETTMTSVNARFDRVETRLEAIAETLARIEHVALR